MTVQMLASWGQYEHQSIQSLSTSEESRLVGLGLARYYFMNADGRTDRALQLSEAGVTLVGPKGTGWDQTKELQDLFSDARSTVLASGLKRGAILLLPNEQYITNGNTLESDLDYIGDAVTLVKASHGSGDFTNSTQSVLRTRIQQDGGSFYGQADNIRLRGLTIDCNNKVCLSGILNTFSVRNFTAEDVTIVNAQDPWYGGWAWMNGGQTIRIYNPRIIGGYAVGNDGLHTFFGTDIKIFGGYIESGDDCIPFGTEYWAWAYYDDEGIDGFQVFGTECRSKKTAGFKAYGPSTYGPQGYIPGLKRGQVRNGLVYITGWCGQERGGGAMAQNEAPSQTVTATGSITGYVMTITAISGGRVFKGAIVAGSGVSGGTYITGFGTGEGGTGTYIVSASHAGTGSVTLTISGSDTTLVSDIYVGGSLKCGGVSHDGQMPFATRCVNATDITFDLGLSFIDVGNPTHGFQRVLCGVTATTQTNLNTESTYSFTVSKDGASAVTVTVNGKSDWLSLYQEIVTKLAMVTDVTCEWEGGHLKFVSPTLGAASTITITAGTLFTGSLAGFMSIESNTQTGGVAAHHMGLGYFSNTRNLTTKLRCSNAPGRDGYEFYNCVNWTSRNHIENIAAGKFLYKAGVSGSTTTVDTSGDVVSSQNTGGYADPNSGRVQRWVMNGGDVQGCNVKFNATPATSYAIAGVLGVTSRQNGTFQIVAGQTQPVSDVTVNSTPRLHYGAGNPGRAESQVKIVPLTTGAPQVSFTCPDNNTISPRLSSAAVSTWTYAWSVDAGFSAV